VRVAGGDNADNGKHARQDGRDYDNGELSHQLWRAQRNLGDRCMISGRIEAPR
jgi:hypothetical protein